MHVANLQIGIAASARPTGSESAIKLTQLAVCGHLRTSPWAA
jgi:hypothetical protein